MKRDTPTLRVWRLFAIAGTMSLWAAFAGIGQTAEEVRAGPHVLSAAIEGPIGPATTRHVGQVFALARERPVRAVLLRLDTPGGLADSMRIIISEILKSPVPVIGHVAPAGAHAASAGTYILYATHVAAMAPGTNLGAATPVAIGGLPKGLPGAEDGSKESEKDGKGDEGGQGGAKPLSGNDAMTAKATNDAVALIRSLAELHGRNADWAEKAVREAASLSAEAALKEGVIDLVARDEAQVLAAADCRTVTVAGRTVRLDLAGLPVERMEPDRLTRILSVLSNPNVALVLMMIGIYGLIFEFWNPGALVPGVAGAISLTLGLYSLNQLPLDYAGLALLVMGIGFMVAEAFSPSFGILGFGGLIAFMLGAGMLVDTDVAAFQVSWWLIGVMGLVSAGFLVLLLGYTLRAYRHAGPGGSNRLEGSKATVLDWNAGAGHVLVAGERWQALGPPVLATGDIVRIKAVSGLTVTIAPDPGAPPAGTIPRATADPSPPPAAAQIRGG